jgi:hypothetical protein
MIISIWGQSGENHLNNYYLYKKKIFFKRAINNEFLLIDYIFSFSKKNKIKIISLDRVKSPRNIDFIIFFDLPNFNNPILKKFLKFKKKLILVANESEAIYPENFKKKNHKHFDKVFTWKDDLIDNKKYFKFYQGFETKKNLPKLIRYSKKVIYKKKKLCCLISGNKIINYNKTLYPLRLEIIKWFEKNYPLDFDLFGIDWDKRFFVGPKILRIFNRISFLCRFFSYKFKCYRGIISPLQSNKIKILRNYKFSFAFENAYGFRGLISEKIFDCFFSLTVPIYLGASNIAKYVPRNCFIDFRDFKNFNEMFLFLKNMTEEDYYKYLKNINFFLKSKKFNVFTTEYNARVIFNKIL